MKFMLIILIAMFLSFQSNVSAHDSTPKDVFPLSIQNSWKYSFRFSNTNLGNMDGSRQIDSGLVSYSIVDSFSNNDTVAWTVSKKRNFLRTLQDLLLSTIIHETSYVVIDSSSFKMYELNKDNHLLFIGGVVNLVSPWPFYFTECNNSTIYRYQVVDSSNNLSTAKINLCDHPGQLYMTHQLTFGVASGLIGNIASGDVGYGSHSGTSLTLQLLDKNVILSNSSKSELSHEDSEPFLYQNYPNPFNPATKIRFMLPERSYVKLKIYNLLGQEVADLGSSVVQEGYHEENFDASHLASGLYFCRMESVPLRNSSATFVSTKKLLLLK